MGQQSLNFTNLTRRDNNNELQNEDDIIDIPCTQILHVDFDVNKKTWSLKKHNMIVEHEHDDDLN